MLESNVSLHYCLAAFQHHSSFPVIGRVGTYIWNDRAGKFSGVLEREKNFTEDVWFIYKEKMKEN